MGEKVFFIFGTRPEAIKMAPVIKEIENVGLEPVVISTGQHEEMLDQVLDIFDIRPAYKLLVMKGRPDLFELTTSLLRRLRDVFEREKPSLVMVQGDTTSTFIGALAAFYNKLPIGYIEAGLRSFNKFEPFPEELNRSLTTRLADLHFAPTSVSEENLLREGIDKRQIHAVGNTVIDSLIYIQENLQREQQQEVPDKFILITAHRRENWGQPMEDICSAINKLSEIMQGMHFLFSVHKNPAVRETVKRMLGDNERIDLVEPVDYFNFVYLMSKASLILSDSGGIQEEAPALGKPLLVLRDTTERPEGIRAGAAKLVGTATDQIVNESLNLLNDKDIYKKMANVQMLYGKGDASKKIAAIVKEYLHREDLLAA